MTWTMPVSFFGGAGERTQKTFTVDTLVGDLWTLCGSPAGARAMEITVDGCDIGNVIISPSWTNGSTFEFVCINGGRIVGLGGNGGAGGNDNGGNGTPGFIGVAGGHALSSAGFAVNVNIDDGYLLGGGGGGGGGAYNNTGFASGNPGSGGGGGAGFSTTIGGTAGTPTGLPVAYSGGNGGPSGPGIGGGTGPTPLSGLNGGVGGDWGAAGNPGRAISLILFSNYQYPMGTGGMGGHAFKPTIGGSIVFIGGKSEATLRSELRLRGEITEAYPRLVHAFTQTDNTPGASTHGFTFQSDGRVFATNTIDGSLELQSWYSAGTTVGIGDDYEIRIRFEFLSNDNGGDPFNWAVEPVAPASLDWTSLTSNVVWNVPLAAANPLSHHYSLYQIRRADAATDDLGASGMYLIKDISLT